MTFRHSWNQPICQSCWDKREESDLLHPLKEVGGPVEEKCAVCGKMTDDGIVARVNPVTVRYPRMEEV